MRTVLALGVLLLTAAALTSIALGSRSLSVAEVSGVFAGNATPELTSIIAEFRLPRTIAAILGGAALAVAGAMMQGHTRNRLADPGLLGVTGGSAAAVVLAMSFLGIRTPAGYIWFAMGGAVAGVVAVTVIATAASRRTDSSPATLVLAGAAVSALLGAVSGIVLLLDSAALERYRFWTVGSLAAIRGLDTVTVALPAVVLGLALGFGTARALDVLSLGDDVATSLGRSVLGTKVVGFTAITLLVAGAVACCGSLAFVGLIVPNALRLIVGPGHRVLLPASALFGAVLTVLADTAGRFLVHPGELPVGIVLSLIGGPLFVALVVRAAPRRRA